MTDKYSTWKPEMTTQDRIDTLRTELEHFKEQYTWSIEYAARLEKAIKDKQEALDLEVAAHLKTK